jgi:hypothetical protein
MRRQEKKQALDIELFSSIADTPGNHIRFLSTTAAVNVSQLVGDMSTPGKSLPTSQG